MKRRQVLVAAGVTTVVGVVGYRSLQAPPTPGPVTSIDFTTRESDPPARPDEPPAIDVRDSEDRIAASGTFLVGNECDAATLNTVEYDESTDELVIEVVGEDDSLPWKLLCTDIEQFNECELTVEVESVPTRGTVIERGPFDDARTSVEP